uniref:Uncharacterized protein n=1 Tax=Salix viminalis TaxID=40686 RepID=A0A6N2KHL3_SALVM
MILRPFGRLKRKTTAPSGHSTTAATANAKNPTVGPSTLHRQGLLVVPHWIHIGTQTTSMFEMRKGDFNVTPVWRSF